MVHAAGSDTIKVGLVGCGGRGTGAAEQALTADSGTPARRHGRRLPGPARRAASRASRARPSARRVDVPKDRQYSGFDAYKNVIDQVDVVLLTTPPHFRPLHLAYAVEKGVHAFVEKPMAVDAPGVCASSSRPCKDAKAKNLSLVNGFCWRYYNPRRETMKQVFDGKIGDIVAIETTYNSQGVWDPRKTREQCSSDMEYQMRNWYYYSWLSRRPHRRAGGPRHRHDGLGHGRQAAAPVLGRRRPAVRTDPKYGNIYDHFSIVYEYPNDVRGYHHCRHWVNTPNQVKDYVLGTKGMADVFGNAITGENKWRYRGQREAPTCTRPSTTRCSPRSAPASRSTTASRPPAAPCWRSWAGWPPTPGQVITPEQVLNSKHDLSPARYEFGPNPVPPVPVPGTTKFI